DDAELGALRGVLHVVVADRVEFSRLAGPALNPEELAVLLDVLLLVGMPEAGDITQLAIVIPHGGAPGLAWRAACELRSPHIFERPPVAGNLIRAVADVRREDALADDLAVREGRRHRARAVVEAPDI